MRRIRLAPHLVHRLAALLHFARADEPLPQLGRDAGDVEGAGDGRGVQRSQVGGGQSGPPGGLEVNDNQLLLQQDHQRRRLVELWGGEAERTSWKAGKRRREPERTAPTSAGLLTFLRLDVVHGEEVDDPGREV